MSPRSARATVSPRRANSPQNTHTIGCPQRRPTVDPQTWTVDILLDAAPLMTSAAAIAALGRPTRPATAQRVMGTEALDSLSFGGYRPRRSVSITGGVSDGLGLSPSSALSRPRRYCWWLPSRRPRGVDHHAADDRIVVVSSGRSRVGVCDHLFLSSRGHDFSPVVALTPSNLPTSWVAACRELLVQGPHQLSGCCLGEPVAVLAFAEQGPPLVPHSRKGPAQWRGPRSIARNRKRSACPGRADRQRRPTECVRPHRGAPSGMRVCPAVTT
jgi:hypothetical protein